MKKAALSTQLFSRLDVLVIVILACVPLFATFPYRVNIFLSWEGAYRMSQGELPFRDFGTPLGGMYWVIPALFFKVFGPQMITLIKAQVLINIIGGLAFRSILKSLSLDTGLRIICVVLFCLSYSFFNFWPWYNHSVIMYELVGLAFLFRYAFTPGKLPSWLWVVVSALFMVFSFFTKQDGGAMAFCIGAAILGYLALRERKWLPLIIYVGTFLLLVMLYFVVFSAHGVHYWLNYGQTPHSARVSAGEIVNDFFYQSQWIKFYLLLILLLSFLRFRSWRDLLNNRMEALFLLLTLGILGEAAVFQVTSYTPPDNNIFFHSFGFAYALHSLAQLSPVHIMRGKKFLFICLSSVLLWWSGTFWKYIDRVIARAFPSEDAGTALVSPTGENVVNRQTYMLTKPEEGIPMHLWQYSKLKSFEKIYMPQPTIDGMERLLDMELVRSEKDLKVLNMTELTPLAVEMPFKLEKGSHYPLWYHLGVSMFNREATMFEERIARNEYDLVLFEHIPSLNNFYPFRVRDSLQVHYQQVDSFMAPRRGDTQGVIEVYVRKQEEISL